MVTPPNPLVLGRAAPAFLPFRARWPWIGGDLQTVRNTLSYRAPDFSAFPAQRLSLPARDGTRLLAMLNQPAVPSSRPVVVLVHGLTGCEDSRNIMTSAAYHLSRGHAVVRLNLRGAGPSRGACNGTYHAGRSADIRDAIGALPPALTANGVLLIGVSLGGNACLKFLAEGDGTERVIAAASVCAPIDLKMAQQRIGSRRNAVYERHLLRFMHADALANAGSDGTELAKALAGVRTVYDFDDRIVAPANGFEGAEDYYRRSSAGPLLGAIKVPTLLVHSRTDPWVPTEMYLSRTWQASSACTLLLTPDGGHVGFHAKDSHRQLPPLGGFGSPLCECVAPESIAAPSLDSVPAVTLVRPLSQGLQDWLVLDEMKDCLRRHLNAGLLECAALGKRDLGGLEADAVIADLRRAFDPSDKAALIQDAFTDAFFAHVCRLKQSGCEPLSRRATLPSGAPT